MRIFQRILKPLEGEVLLGRDVQQGVVRTGKGLDIIKVCPDIPRSNLVLLNILKIGKGLGVINVCLLIF